MRKHKTFETLFLDELKDLYDAEHQLVKALPKLAEAASDPGLKAAIQAHLRETETHVSRAERAFALLGEEADRKNCAGIAGIIKEAGKVLDEGFEGPVLDAGIIAGAQRAEHYEMGAYGSLIAWAKLLGKDDVASLL